MPSALLWAYSAENLFYNCNSGKSADFPELLFHRWGRRGKQHLQRRFLRKRGAVEGLPICSDNLAVMPKAPLFGGAGKSEGFDREGEDAFPFPKGTA